MFEKLMGDDRFYERAKDVSSDDVSFWHGNRTLCKKKIDQSRHIRGQSVVEGDLCVCSDDRTRYTRKVDWE